jgi:hypothetical protein
VEELATVSGNAKIINYYVLMVDIPGGIAVQRYGIKTIGLIDEGKAENNFLSFWERVFYPLMKSNEKFLRDNGFALVEFNNPTGGSNV